MDKLSFNLVGMNCYGTDGGAGGTVALGSLTLPSNGSFSTKFTSTFTGGSVPVNYILNFRGHFHGVNSSGASRAAGSYLLTGSYTKNGTLYHCTSNKQWWTAPPLNEQP